MCQKCGRIFRTIGAFQGHLKKYHANVGDESKLKEEKAVSEGVLVLNEGSLFECKFCMNYSNTNAREVRQHIVRVHLEKRFSCEHCDKAFPRETFLAKHIALHHLGLEGVDCPECNKNFKNKSYLAYHQNRMHRKLAAFDCDVCQKSFFRKCEYESHMEVHKPDDERNWKFECEICQKRFRFKSNLNYHMLEHTGVRAYHCPICKMKFKTCTIRNSHVKNHNVDRPYQCPHCDKYYKHQKYLDVHLLSHNEGQKFSCKACCRIFPHSKALQKHVCKAVKLNMDPDQLQKIGMMTSSVDMDASTLYTIPDVPDPSENTDEEEEQGEEMVFNNQGVTVNNRVVTWSVDSESTTDVMESTSGTITNLEEVLQTTQTGYISLPDSVAHGLDAEGNLVIYEPKNPEETEEVLQHLVHMREVDPQSGEVKVMFSESELGDTGTVNSVIHSVSIDDTDEHSNGSASNEVKFIAIKPNANRLHGTKLPRENFQITTAETENNEIVCEVSLQDSSQAVSVSSSPVEDINVFTMDQGEHLQNTVYMCGICDLQYASKEEIEAHLLEEHIQNC